MTPPVSGGVPEQGPQVYPDLTSEQIDEIARILDEPQLKRLHGGILALSLRYVAAVQEAPRAIRQLRAALERPRPALPEPTRLDLSGISEEEWGMLAEMKPPALRAALTMLAKAQANGDA